MRRCRYHLAMLCRYACAAAGLLACLSHGAAADDRPADKPQAKSGALLLDGDPTIVLRCGGPIGERVNANVSGWLLPCPQANPGLLEMFRLRDRQPPPQLVPWAGEFVGKYLISAIEALRMSDDVDLRRQVAAIMRDVCDSQADDGYLGPFPTQERLLAHWDLWGHYHVMQALLMWHERTGDARSLECARKAADLMARTYLGGKRRVYDAGSQEMNMAVIHGLGALYRQTSEPRYRELMAQIEEDWPRAGDYLRTGLAGDEFFRTPRPRWESLHDLQGLVELYRIRGEPRYRDAFLHHWSSIRRWDRRTSGAFSSGEQASGNPYEQTPIETCCTIAWMALSLDALRLTGDPQVADELELSLFNAVCGAQHPSGRWWTYSTPLDGVREASAHAIVFQARAGTPELNCCSVNGPRGLGVLSEWGFMRFAGNLAVNYYGDCQAEVQLSDNLRVTLVEETNYPRDFRVRIHVAKVDRIPPTRSPAPFKIALRIPAWSRRTSVWLNDQAQSGVEPGQYFTIERNWQAGDVVQLDLDLDVRYVAGDLDAAGRVALYRGPLLLAFDQADENKFDEADLPPIDLTRLKDARARFGNAAQPRPSAFAASMPENNRPWTLVGAPLVDGSSVTLRDYASAGSAGTRYRSWLKAQGAVPPAPVAWQPADGARVPAGRMLFTWRRPASADRETRRHRVMIARDASFNSPLVSYGDAKGDRLIVPAEETAKLAADLTYYWKLVATNEHGETESLAPYKSFRIDPSLPALDDAALAPYGQRDDGVVIDAPLAGKPEPSFGKLALERGWQSAAGPDDKPDGAVQLDGAEGILRYQLARFPAEEYTLLVNCRIDESAFAAPRSSRVQQIASAWCRPADDPLRLFLQGGKLFARLESPGGGGSTPGVPLEAARWYSIALVKQGARLRLYIDGQQRAEMTCPAVPVTDSIDLALGGNPLYTGDEYLPARFAGLRLYAIALSAEDVQRAALPATK